VFHPQRGGNLRPIGRRDRQYHDIDLLVPREVDAATGYRRYSPEQVDAAHLIRRLRELDMPLAEIREVLAGPRDDVVARHLDRMEGELARIRGVVRIAAPAAAYPPPAPVTHRRSPASTVVYRRARLARDEVADWCGRTYPELHATLAREGLARSDSAGPGALPTGLGWCDEVNATGYPRALPRLKRAAHLRGDLDDHLRLGRCDRRVTADVADGVRSHAGRAPDAVAQGLEVVEQPISPS